MVRRQSSEKRASRFSARRVATIGAALAVTGFSACGGDAQSSAVVRVGDVAITRSDVAHWTNVIERGGVAGSLPGEPGTPRRQALTFLISSRWLNGEAAFLGSPVSPQAIAHALVEHREADGTEFEEQLHAAGKTIADAKLELGAELAAAAIRRYLATRAAAITETEIVAFYRHDQHPFQHHEGREIDLIEHLRSPGAAEALIRRIGTGRAFAKIAFHDRMAENTDKASGAASNSPLTKAIFAAPQGVVSRPIRFHGEWAVFIVRKIIPATVKPLSEVRGEVIEKLTAQREHQLTKALAAEYRARWRAKTSCNRGYVVPWCAQYAGSVVPEQTPPF